MRASRVKRGDVHAPRRPNVDRSRIRPTPQQHVRCAVPERHHLIRERIYRHTERSGQAKVAEFEFASFRQEKVLGFEVSVEDAVVVAESDSLFRVTPHTNQRRNVSQKER